MEGFDPKQLLGKAAKWKVFAAIAGVVGPYVALVMVVVVVGGAAVATVAAIGQAADKIWGGITSVVSLPGDLIDSLTGTNVDETIKRELDCSNFAAEERDDGVCIEGLLDMGEQQQSPVPASAEWLVPVWQKAAAKHKIPWELLAAVNAARTHFGDRNCETAFGSGFYRMPHSAWSRYEADGGHAKTERSGDCRESAKPANLKKPDKRKDIYDAVDASFAQARLLSAAGAGGERDWEYEGGPIGSCVPDRKQEGTVYFMPEFSGGQAGEGARLGYNRKLSIDRRVVELAAKYRSDTGKWKPARTFVGQASMPVSDVRRILREVWSAFGASGQRLDSLVARNMRQIQRESGFRPQVLQGYIGDVNDNNPAGGLVQFIPGTFNYWMVGGFEDRFNPLDNLLAAVNAQVNSPHIAGAAPDGILDGRDGWSPQAGPNPYREGGRSEVADGARDSAERSDKPKPYSGPAQSDPVSKAVASNGPGADKNSECYVAIVNEWYEGIKNNPPMGDFTAGGVRGKIVKIAQQELAIAPAEVAGCNCGAPVARYNFPAGDPWCAWWTTWVWGKAGVNISRNGLVSYVRDWGRQRGLFKTRSQRPAPGDAIIYGYDGASHIGIVEKVSGNSWSSIGGNQSDTVSRWSHPTTGQSPMYVYGFVSPTRGGGGGFNTELNTDPFGQADNGPVKVT